MDTRHRRPALFGDSEQRREFQPHVEPHDEDDTTSDLGQQKPIDPALERAFEDSWAEHGASYRYLIDR